MVLVSVKVQGVKSQFLCGRQNSGLNIHQKPICAQPRTTHIMYFVVLRGPGSHSRKVSVWLCQTNDMQIIMFSCHAQMCLSCAYKGHVSVRTFFVDRNYVTPTVV